MRFVEASLREECFVEVFRLASCRQEMETDALYMCRELYQLFYAHFSERADHC